MKVDPRFLNSDGPEIFTGNELLLKGALEAEGGVHLLGGYPGSPVAGFFDALAQIKDLLNEKGIRAVINNNEALAAAMLNGSQVIGARGMIVMKSVGVHVAADALALGNLAGANPDGGAIVVYGDDPWSDSTQVAADSRYISKHLFIPVIEPSDPQEVKDFVDLSLKLSRASELYAGYVLTTNLADGGGSVLCRPNQFPAFSTRRKLTLDTRAIDLDKYVLLPPKTWWQEESLADRFERAIGAARGLGLNRIEHLSDGVKKPIGFVTSGLAYAYLVQALREMDLLGELPVAKFGLTYPLDMEIVRRLAGHCQRIVVVEERRGFMEEQIGEAMTALRQSGDPAGRVELWGKRFPEGLKGIPATRGLHPSIVIERLAPLIEHACRDRAAPAAVLKPVEREVAAIEATGKTPVSSQPPRLPTFCPGCPHRDSAAVCLEIRKHFADPDYMQRTHACGPVDLVFHGDTGCYTMLMFPPNTELMHDYSGMGLGGGTGSGVDPFVTNKQAVFMGDSTFFHSGQIAISQALKLNQDITFIILDNRTTGMTGHQPTPGVDYDILGNPTRAQSIDEIVRGMTTDTGDGEVQVVRVDVEQRMDYLRLLEKTFLADGVKIVIADKECGITRLRRKRRQERSVTRRLGYLPTWEHMNVNAEICRFCLACAEQTACPGLKHVDTDYGRKIDTDLTWCVNDGACERIGSCSAFERVIVKRKAPARTRVPELDLEGIPEPTRRPLDRANGSDAGWRCCLAGVGGMGVGVATTILVRAGHKEGYQVLFLDKKGLAIRNGGVVSQVVYNIGRQPITAVIPYGKADLLIGIDVLEAVRTLDPRGRARVGSPLRTAAVINTHKNPTIGAVMGKDDFDPEQLAAVVRANTRGDDFLARDISRICEKYLGSKLYSNIMMLGFAFQKGLIPVSMHSIAWAIKDSIRADFRKNLYAFNMGRKLVVDPNLFQGPPRRDDWRDLLEDKCRWTIRRYRRGQALADALRQLAAETVAALGEVDEPLKRAVVVRLYDCMRWGGMDYARRYALAVAGIRAKDAAEHGLAATRAVIFNLANAMLVKDAVFLAELSTSPEKLSRDREKYNVNPANGDRIAYRHLWHVPASFGRWRGTLDLTLYPWMLRPLRSMHWLRKALPRWHADEKSYLAEYERRVARFAWKSPQQYRDQLVKLSSPRCMNCADPACSESGCPLSSRVPAWVQLAYQHRWREAAETLHRYNNFPEFTAKICPALCQDACKQGHADYPVQIRDIESAIVERAFDNGWMAPQPAAKQTGRKVAVIGSGPAGLAAAQQLARAGHEVTVFERDAHVGGLLRYGIPDHRLAKELIDRRIDQLRAEGVQFHTGAAVGSGVTGQTLLAEFDAVLLAVGARRPRDLAVPGRDAPGVHLAMDFLRQANDLFAGRPVAKPIEVKGKTVAVIGGGLTGEDCVETALAAGAHKVHHLEILPEAAATPGGPGIGMRIEPPDEVSRHWSVATKAFECGDGMLSALRTRQVAWEQSPAGPQPRELAGTDGRVAADVAILAMGFERAVDGDLAGQLGLATDGRGLLVVKNYQTSAAKVFAAGDAVTGARYVATAIDSGRKAAAKIDAFLAAAPAPAPAPAEATA